MEAFMSITDDLNCIVSWQEGSTGRGLTRYAVHPRRCEAIIHPFFGQVLRSALSVKATTLEDFVFWLPKASIVPRVVGSGRIWLRGFDAELGCWHGLVKLRWEGLR